MTSKVDKVRNSYKTGQMLQKNNRKFQEFGAPGILEDMKESHRIKVFTNHQVTISVPLLGDNTLPNLFALGCSIIRCSYIHICNGILAIKKEQNNAICSNMDGPRDCHTE